MSTSLESRDELVPVYETDTGEKVVYGTELHKALTPKRKFADWVKNRINDCDAKASRDSTTLTKNLVSGGQYNEYIIKLDTAKEMAMLERERFTSNKEHLIEGGMNQ